MTEVVFKNEDLIIIKSLGTYIISSDNKIRCTYDGECNIDRVCIECSNP